MRRATVVLAALAFPALAGASPPEPVNDVRGAGTAWPTPSGYVVTNHHLVNGRGEIVLVDADGRAFDARIVADDPANDVAVLAVESPEALPPGLPMHRGKLRLGAGLFTLGFPRIDVMGTSPKLAQGIVSGLTGVRDDPNGFLVSVPIQPGNSGGPLLDRNGEVVGMIVSMVAAPTGTSGGLLPLPNVNCAVGMDAIGELLEGLPAEGASVRAGAPATASGAADLESLVARVERSVLIVLAR